MDNATTEKTNSSGVGISAATEFFNKASMVKFVALLQREVIEHRNAFLYGPAVVSFLLLVVWIWGATSIIMGGTGLFDVVEMLTDSAGSETNLAPGFAGLAIPYSMVLFIVSLVYSVNCLYQERKESSTLFWQSMPVSNTQAVLAKVITVVFVAPLFSAVVFYLFTCLLLMITLVPLVFGGLEFGFLITSLVQAFLFSVNYYLAFVAAAVLLFPTIAWLLLFSAFANKSPVLWAIGSYFLIVFLEDIVFNTQFLTDWSQSRFQLNQYLVFSFSDFVERLFNYDTLIGLFLGAILITGAIYMRRFAD